MIDTPIDPSRLAPERSHYNPGLIRYGGEMLMSYRTGWAFSRHFLTRLGDDWQPIGPQRRIYKLPLYVPDTGEDCRLFEHAGKLLTSYTNAYTGTEDRRMRYAEITPSGAVLADYWLNSPDGAQVEKNWQFFSHEGDLLCIYTIAPEHRIYAVRGNTMREIARTPFPYQWPYGEPRGGTPPVRIGDNYFSFFHSSLRGGDWRTGHGLFRHYYGGCYSFAAKAPFHVTGFSQWPLLMPCEPTGQHRAAWEAWQCARMRVVFPAGLLFEDGDFVVSYGVHDAACHIARFAFSEVTETF